MRLICPLNVALVIFASTGPAPAQIGGQAPPQLFSVTTSGPAAVAGRADLRFEGIAFPVGPDTLLTSAAAIGNPAQFRPLVQFAQGSVPDRSIALAERAGSAQTFTATAVPSSGPAAAVALLRNEQQPALNPLRLSACGTGSAQLRLLAGTDIAVAPVLSGGVVTHFRLMQQVTWDAARALGAPALDGEGRVVGLLTDATADGQQVAITPIAAITQLLPRDTPIACDPRVNTRDLANLLQTTDELLERVRIVEERLEAQSVQIEDTGRAVNVVISGLADVADVLPTLAAARANQQDIGPILETLSEKLKPAQPLVRTVTSISTILQRPTWTTKAKIADRSLTLTFTYRMQLPGRAFSPTLRLCTRVVAPYQGNRESDQYFRTPNFYAAAVRTDPGRLVRCKEVIVNVPDRDSPSEWGEYRAELYLSDFEYDFRQYTEGRNWIDPDYEWNRIIFIALVKPGADAQGQGGGADLQGGTVVQRALIRLPDIGDSVATALPVECRAFDSDQEVIDFLAERRPPVSPSDLSNTGFDDVSGLELDPANASDECVLSSAP